MIVEPIMPEKEIELELPDNVKESWAAQHAIAFRVRAAGPGWWEDGQFHKMPVEVGDVVVLEGKLAVAKITYEGEDYHLAQGRYVALIKNVNEGVTIEKGGNACKS